MAVGIGLVFGVLRLVNFAYGQLVMAGAFALALAAQWSWPVWAGIVLCFAVVIVLSALMDRLVFRPLRGHSPAGMPVPQVAGPVPPPEGPPGCARDAEIVVLAGGVVGGRTRAFPATLGGFAIGFASGILGGALPTNQSQYLPAFLFVAVILVLLVRPRGVFDFTR